ncbi:MAG TPA: response regulator transcription factor [Chloroflexota bacterium]|nr:response regulator transcription factor [Chloroflexota bacterium]
MSILLVMSDDIDARLASYLLGQVVRTVVIAATVAEARRLLAERAWSAVILDTVLPDGSGFDFLRTLREADFDGGIMMLTASREVGDKVRALEEGADDYVVRPYEPAEFLARVKALLRRSRRRASNAVTGGILRVGDVELDLNSLQVVLPGNRRERLTPNEMRLLHYLMSHSQRVVEHQELLLHLFGTAEHQSSTNAIGVYMRRVRQKIEPDPDHPRYIVTIRGSGYRFYGHGSPDDNDDTTPGPSTPPKPTTFTAPHDAHMANGGPGQRPASLSITSKTGTI